MKISAVQDRKKLLKDELDRIVGIIRTKYDPEKIILFGSLALDSVHEWSDIDLLIVKNTDKRPIDRIMEVTRLIHPRIGVDLFIYTPEEYELLLKERYSFLLNILTTGKTMYENRSSSVA